MKIRLIGLVIFTLIFNNWVKSQNKSSYYDTVFIDIPELIVNNNSFLYDLDTMFQKSYLCEIRDDCILTIEVKQTNEGIYLFTIIQSLLEINKRRLIGSKGFFTLNGVCFFVEGTELLSEYPKGLFTITNNLQSFYYLKIKPNLYEIGCVDCECLIYLEYKDGNLFFLRKYW
jgi:hypothetical protein